MMTAEREASVLGLDFNGDTARQFDKRAPRYTSYPTADRFSETFGPASYRAAAARRGVGGARRPLALYLHLPFCRDICWYCACNKIVNRNQAKAEEYLRCLEKEIGLQGDLFRDDPRVAQMHWGGGTPTYYSTETLRGLFMRIMASFELLPQGDYSIEVDPRTVNKEALDALRCMGFNRVSFGVQDFDEQVQAAIHRVQSVGQTLEVIAAARRAGFASINVDLVYGLPKQTPETLDNTLTQVVAALPGRIALYNYAHLPSVFKAQRRIREMDLPSAEARLSLFALAASRFTAAGYVQVGMDHFALPSDALAVAQRRGRLRRDFQGYSAGPDCDLVGLGVSAIGGVGSAYSQNCRSLQAYYERVNGGELPIFRGLELTRDDLVRRAVIQSLMCDFCLSMRSTEIAYLVDFDHNFAAELEQLTAYEDMGLLELEEGWIRVTPKGRPVIRSICMVFDRYLRHDADTRRYSRML
jgi:oxygen-independent coproporphyrinogen III oxidase